MLNAMLNVVFERVSHMSININSNNDSNFYIDTQNLFNV